MSWKKCLKNKKEFIDSICIWRDYVKVQVITGNQKLNSTDNFLISDYGSPRAMDDFDIIIIDLSYEKLWVWEDDQINGLNRNNDLLSVSNMVETSESAQIVYVYPQNISYSFYHLNSGYKNRKKLKDIIYSFGGTIHICKAFPNGIEPHVIFEPTITKVENKNFNADFHFEQMYGDNLTESELSKKSTTVRLYNNIVITTLDICKSIEDLEKFIRCVLLDDKNDDIPEWIKEYEFGNDNEQKNIILTANEQIVELQKKIEAAEQQLKKNNRYKTILCNNGESLVKVIFEILEKLFDCDLSGFVDEKKEDFIIEKNGLIFIGEIKGVTSNIKSEHVSQLEVHYQTYLDEHQEEINDNNVHGLLIINPFRTKELSDRDSVHERQIGLAKRNNSLIIETITLLKIFELHQKGNISSDQCIEVLSNKTGLLSVDDFKVNNN